MLLLALLACRPEAVPEPPLDDVLRLHHVQAKGSHNSYHVATEGMVDELQYTHAPLDVQLDAHGVRHFELDVWLSDETDAFVVEHIPVIDERTTCSALVDCLAVLKRWSDARPFHAPFTVLVETKDADEAEIAYLDALEAEIASVWPADRLVTPDLVQGDAASVADAVAEHGWPTLGAVRGRAMLVLHGPIALHERYTEGGTTTSGRLMFPAWYGPPQPAVAAVEILNDPVDDADRIADALAGNRIVRTRADSSLEIDEGRAAAALDSGAHLISTDFVDPDGEHVFAIPGGAPFGCNPVTAPSECTPAAIEDPAWLVVE